MNNIDKLTETFAYEDSFYQEFSVWLDDFSPAELEDFEEVILHNCILQKVIDLDQEKMYEMIANRFEDNQSEGGFEWEDVEKIVRETFTEKMLKDMMDRIPSLWWPEGDSVTVTKKDILEWMEKNNYEID